MQFKLACIANKTAGFLDWNHIRVARPQRAHGAERIGMDTVPGPSRPVRAYRLYHQERLGRPGVSLAEEANVLTSARFIRALFADDDEMRTKGTGETPASVPYVSRRGALLPV